MRRYTLAGFATLGTLQSRDVEVAGESATVDATRTFVAADRVAAVEVLGGALDAQAYLPADPSYLVPGARRFGLIQFSAPGSLQSRLVSVEGAAAGGYLAGRSYAVPDVSGGVAVTFAEVYPI